MSALNSKSKSFVIFLALITAGAIGNIIDGMFYGMLFSESTFKDVAILLPESGGYSSFLDGHVVDMLYFPIIDTWWPEWVPFIGGQIFEFNKYIFNLADLSITVGVFGIIVLEGFLRKKKT
jgi:signal peptidase II